MYRDKIKKLNILFLEDNKEFAKNTIEFLKIYFKNIFHSSTIKYALTLYENESIDLIISDIKVSDGNSFKFIEEIRRVNKTIPIIILSAYKDEDFLFKAINLNINTYKVKPLSYDETMELLKLISSYFDSDDIIFKYKNLSYSFKSKILTINNKVINLTTKETDFLELIFSNKNQIVTYDLIQTVIYKNKIMSDSAIKNLVLRIRKKLGMDIFLTIPSSGYRLKI